MLNKPRGDGSLKKNIKVHKFVKLTDGNVGEKERKESCTTQLIVISCHIPVDFCRGVQTIIHM